MPTYADFPDCLKRYEWLLDDANRGISKMYNQTAFPTCKVCGDDVPRKDWINHRIDHLNSRIIRGKIEKPDEFDVSEFQVETFDIPSVTIEIPTITVDTRVIPFIEEVNELVEQIKEQPKKLWL